MTDPVHQIRPWLDNVVIGLNLCPFAAAPMRQDRVRIATSDAQYEESLLHDLHRELLRLDAIDASETETTLLVISKILQDFDDYNQFLDVAEALVVACGLEDKFQIASFHPHYRFEGSAPDDRANLTNRSPMPILHILRQQSVGDALAKHPNPDDIYKNNIRAVESLDESEMRALFSWLT